MFNHSEVIMLTNTQTIN